MYIVETYTADRRVATHTHMYVHEQLPSSCRLRTSKKCGPAALEGKYTRNRRLNPSQDVLFFLRRFPLLRSPQRSSLCGHLEMKIVDLSSDDERLEKRKGGGEMEEAERLSR